MDELYLDHFFLFVLARDGMVPAVLKPVREVNAVYAVSLSREVVEVLSPALRRNGRGCQTTGLPVSGRIVITGDMAATFDRHAL